jgi:hypothetical protein
MTIKISSAKDKGRRLQKWVCWKISELIGIQVGPDELIASRPMGQSGTDVVLKGQAADRFPFSIECKYCETWHIPTWIAQAKKNNVEGRDWLLFVKRNRIDPVVVLDAEVFMKLMRKIGQPTDAVG